MKLHAIVFVLLVSVIFLACEKNTVSKIPHISITGFVPHDSLRASVDTAYIQFDLTDGDGDIGYADPNSSDNVSQIYIRDSRDSNYVGNEFPAIDVTIEDPKKGLQGTCIVYQTPIVPRTDTLHAKHGDTLYFEFYIKDRAGHESNHQMTPAFRVTP